MVAESPSPGTPFGDQLFGSLQEWLSPPLFPELPIHL
jgi:hypothetical protein